MLVFSHIRGNQCSSVPLSTSKTHCRDLGMKWLNLKAIAFLSLSEALQEPFGRMQCASVPLETILTTRSCSDFETVQGVRIQPRAPRTGPPCRPLP